VMGCEEIRGSDARWLGILRMATEKKVEEKFRKAVENFPEDLEWWAREKVAEVVRCELSCAVWNWWVWRRLLTAECIVEGPPPGRPGVFCRSGMAVDCPAYLTALWECCRASNNVKWTILEIKRYPHSPHQRAFAQLTPKTPVSGSSPPSTPPLSPPAPTPSRSPSCGACSPSGPSAGRRWRSRTPAARGRRCP